MISSDQIKLNVHSNTEPDEVAILYVPQSMAQSAFLREAGERVGVAKPLKAYLLSGAELEKLDGARNNDHVYISAGEKFCKSPDPSGDSSVIRVSILGGGGVGKSAITLRFVRDFFVQNWEATIEDAYRKAVKVDGDFVTLEILDTAGQEDFSTLRAQWMMDKEGYIFVYSLVDRESIEQLYGYIELLEQVIVLGLLLSSFTLTAYVELRSALVSRRCRLLFLLEIRKI